MTTKVLFFLISKAFKVRFLHIWNDKYPHALCGYVHLFLKDTSVVVALMSTRLWTTSFRSKEVVSFIFPKKEGQWATSSKYFFCLMIDYLLTSEHMVCEPRFAYTGRGRI